MFGNMDPTIVADVAAHYKYNADHALKAIMDIQVRASPMEAFSIIMRQLAYVPRLCLG